LEDALALALELADELVEGVLDDELELPHAARPNAAVAHAASAPNLFLITTSPLAGLSIQAHRPTAVWPCRLFQRTVFSTSCGLHVNIP
jgi:hypothetical protein